MADPFVSFTARLPIVTEYDEALAATICLEVAEGKTIEDICRERGLGRHTVARWRRWHPDFDDAYRAACRLHAEALVDRMDALCNDALARGEGKALALKRLTALGPVLKNLEWRAKVLCPEQFGDKHEVAVTGGLALQINTKWPGKTIESEAA